MGIAASALRVKLRSDLICAPQDTAAGSVLVVKDPASGRFFRFGRFERFIVERLDGRPLELLRRQAETEFATELDRETLDTFVAGLGQRGLLHSPGRGPERSTGEPGRVRGQLLHLRFKAFDPDPLLDRLIGRVRFCFTPGFVALATLLIGVALLIVAANRQEIGRELWAILRPETLIVGWLIVFLVTVGHEFAHGLTCKHFGGRVREMGLLLLYFQPALYCNVSDAWLWPEKSRRLWVTFAGGFFELVLWALAVLVWRLSAPETSLHYVALVLLGATGIRMLFNFNPLLKLDGYYLLSDALEVPNLRQRSFAYLGGLLRRLAGITADAAEPPPARERRIYLVYGAFAGIFSCLLLGFILSRFGGFLVSQLRGTGFIIFLGLAVMIFRNPLRRLLPRRGAPAGARPGGPRRRLAVAAAATIVFVGLYLGKLPLTIGEEFVILPAHNADVRAEVEAIIAEVHVDEGERVEAGDLLARLSDRGYRAELDKVRAAIQEKRARLALLEAGSRAEEIAVARGEVEAERVRQLHAARRLEEARRMRAQHVSGALSSLEKAQQQLAYAERELRRTAGLVRKRIMPETRLEEAEQTVAVRGKELAEAQAAYGMVLADDLAEMQREVALAEQAVVQAERRLELLLAGSRREEIDAAKAEIARLAAERDYLEQELEALDVRSPITGIVTTPRPREGVGRLVEKGDLILEVYSFETVTAEILVPEKEIGDIRIGQDVVLKARAYPGRAFEGTVIAVAPVASDDAQGLQRKVVRVLSEIANPDLALKPAMTGYAKIYADDRRLIELVTRRLVRFLRVEFWSWW